MASDDDLPARISANNVVTDLGMANRFSTLTQYRTIILAHGVLAALVFLLLVPTSVFTARFYSGRPGYAVKYHAQIHIFAGLLLLVVFILGNFAVGQKRSLTNPHHGIGVAIFVLFILQIIGGRIIRNIRKLRSLRVTIHQWSGRAIALLGIVQIPLGLTLYGSPKYLFILYALWMAFLVLVYFILDYRSPTRREVATRDGPMSEGNYRVTESEYLSDHKPHESSKWKWLGPLAAGTGIWALMRRRKKNKEEDFDRSSYRSYSRSRGPEVIASRRGSASYYEDEKYTDVSAPRKSGGGFMGMLGTAAAAVGAGTLAGKLMSRGRNTREEEYSAVSTETPRRHRAGRGTDLTSEWSSEAPTRYRREEAESSLLPPAAGMAAMAGARSAADSRLGRPVTPTRPHHARHPSRRSFEDSEYSSYVSPSRREPASGGGGGMMKGLLAGLGGGWLAKKMADRRSRKEEQRLREEEEMRGGSTVSRFTGDGFPSPSRRQSQRRAGHRPTGLDSEITESSIEPRPHAGYNAPPAPAHGGAPPVPVPISMSGGRSASHSRSRNDIPSAAMPPMPSDPHGVLYSAAEQSQQSSDGRPQRRPSSRRRRAGAAATAAAAARAADLAADEERSYNSGRDRFASPSGQPAASVRVKMHDDKDRNVTLRRLTEEEARAAAGSRARANSDTSLSGMESPSAGRQRYRRDNSAQRRAERVAERRVEAEDTLAPLSPPNPAFAKGRRAKDSAYYSGQPGPAGSTPAAGQTMSSLGSLASPESHGTWSGVSASPSGPEKPSASAADNRRRRRLERRRGSSARPVGTDMFD